MRSLLRGKRLSSLAGSLVSQFSSSFSLTCNARAHIGGSGDSPVCRNRWFLRFVCLLKPREQTWHLNGHEPLCTYMCDLRSPGVGKDLEHRAHLCGFSCTGRRAEHESQSNGTRTARPCKSPAENRRVYDKRRNNASDNAMNKRTKGQTRERGASINRPTKKAKLAELMRTKRLICRSPCTVRQSINLGPSSSSTARLNYSRAEKSAQAKRGRGRPIGRRLIASGSMAIKAHLNTL